MMGKASFKNPGLKGMCHLSLVPIKLEKIYYPDWDTCENGKEDC